MTHRMHLIVLALVVTIAGIAAQDDTLRRPDELTERAPDVYRARFETTKGVFIVEAYRDWAPLAADRFYNLVKNGYYDGARFFRVIDGFMAQFGLHGDPAVNSAWRFANLRDEPVKQGNRRGIVTFTNEGSPSSRFTQVFINTADNPRLDKENFPGFGQVLSGMNVVDKLYSGYGRDQQPDQRRIIREGNAYLTKEFPKLDSIRRATIVRP